MTNAKDINNEIILENNDTVIKGMKNEIYCLDDIVAFIVIHNINMVNYFRVSTWSSTLK